MSSHEYILFGLLEEAGVLADYGRCLIEQAELWSKSKTIPSLVQEGIRAKCMAYVETLQ